VILLIDHQDSFTFNLAQALALLGAEVTVMPALALSVEAVVRLRPDRILLGPGPGPPERAQLALELLRAARWPTLGVCLGFQALAVAYGGVVDRAPRAVHGETSRIEHRGQGVFRGLPQGFRAARYHSLSLRPESCSADLEVTAWSAPEPDPVMPREEPLPMGLRHRLWALEGVQFHPESIASESGAALLKNFLAPSFLERGA
jgi:anthranilate synthase component II